MLLVADEKVQSEEATYIIEGVVGRGAFGAVYAANDPDKPGRRVALKEFFIPTHPRDQAAIKDLFEREKYVGAKASSHPLMPTFYEAFKADGRQYIAQEYIEGTTLEDIILNRHPLPREWILKWAVSLCDALAFLHTRQIVHHDLKPANIRITPMGHLVLLDFGAAQYFGVGAEKPVELYGTEGYLPPELDNDGQWVADVRTDIFALGCILYEMIAGEPPDQKQINQRSVYVTNTLIQKPNADLNLVNLINKALSFNTEYRYQGAQEFLVEIRKVAPPVLLVDQKRLRFGNVTTGQLVAPQQVSPFNAGGGDLRLEVKPRCNWLAVSKANTDIDNMDVMVHVDVAKIGEFNKVVTGKLEISSPDELDENGVVVWQGDRWFLECSVKLVPRYGSIVPEDLMSASSSPIVVSGKGDGAATGKFTLKNVGDQPQSVQAVCDLSKAPPFVAEKLKTLKITPEMATIAPNESVDIVLEIPRTDASIGEYRNLLVVKTSENHTIPIPLNVQIQGRSAPLKQTGLLGTSATGIVMNGRAAVPVAVTAAPVTSMQDLSTRQGMAFGTGDGDDVGDNGVFFPVMGSEIIKDKGTVFGGFFGSTIDDTLPTKPNPLKKFAWVFLLLIPAAIWFTPQGHDYVVAPLLKAAGIEDPDAVKPVVKPKPTPPTEAELYLRKMRAIRGPLYGSDGSAGNSHDKAFDGDTNTFFDSTTPNDGYTGMVVGTPTRVYAIRWFPRPGQEGRMNGGVFEGSNSILSGFHPILVLGQAPPAGWYLWKLPQPTIPYKYLRYRGPANGFCNVAEIQFLTRKR